MKANKIINFAVFAFLLVLFSTMAYAKPFTDAFSGGLVQINSFFSGEQYKPYAKTLDFFFFSLLFIAIYMMGARYAFKEVKRPETVIVILLGLMTGFLMVLGGWSATALLPYLQWLLYTLLFILYWWLLKGIKSKFWRFVLALLLTLLTIALLQGLFDQFSAPDAEGFFKSFGKSFRGISLPGISFPGVPDYFQNLFGSVGAPSGPSLTTLPPSPTPPAGKPDEGGFFDSLKNWWWVPLLLLLPLAYWGWRKRKPKGEDKTKEGKEPKSAKLDINKIIEEILQYIKGKEDMLKKMKDIMNLKAVPIADMHQKYHEVLELNRAYWLDPEAGLDKFQKQHDDIDRILKLEFEFENKLHELAKLENELFGFGMKRGKAAEWFRRIVATNKEKEKELIEELNRYEHGDPVTFWDRIRANIRNIVETRFHDSPPWYREALLRVCDVFIILTSTAGTTGAVEDGLCWHVRRNIMKYLLLARQETEIERVWQELIKPKKLEEFVKKKSKWIDLRKFDPTAIQNHFSRERAFFLREFKPALEKQIRYMYYLIRLLQYIQKKTEEFTPAEEIVLEYKDPITAQDVKLKADDPETNTPAKAIPYGIPFKVSTKLGTSGEFWVRCKIGNQWVKQPKLFRTTDEGILIEFKSEEFERILGPAPAVPGTAPRIMYTKDDLSEGPQELTLVIQSVLPRGNAPTTLTTRRELTIRFHIKPWIKILNPAPESEHRTGEKINDLMAHLGVSQTYIAAKGYHSVKLTWSVSGKDTSNNSLTRNIQIAYWPIGGTPNLTSIDLPSNFAQQDDAVLKATLTGSISTGPTPTMETIAEHEIKIKLRGAAATTTTATTPGGPSINITSPAPNSNHAIDSDISINSTYNVDPVYLTGIGATEVYLKWSLTGLDNHDHPITKDILESVAAGSHAAHTVLFNRNSDFKVQNNAILRVEMIGVDASGIPVGPSLAQHSIHINLIAAGTGTPTPPPPATPGTPTSTIPGGIRHSAKRPARPTPVALRGGGGGRAGGRGVRGSGGGRTTPSSGVGRTIATGVKGNVIAKGGNASVKIDLGKEFKKILSAFQIVNSKKSQRINKNNTFANKAWAIFSSLKPGEKELGKEILDLCTLLKGEKFRAALNKIDYMTRIKLITDNQMQYLIGVNDILREEYPTKEALKLIDKTIFAPKPFEILKEFLKNY